MSLRARPAGKPRHRESSRRRQSDSVRVRARLELARALGAYARAESLAEANEELLQALKAALTVQEANGWALREAEGSLRRKNRMVRLLAISTTTLACGLLLSVFWSDQAIRGLEIGGAGAAIFSLIVVFVDTAMRSEDPNLFSSWDDEPRL